MTKYKLLMMQDHKKTTYGIHSIHCLRITLPFLDDKAVNSTFFFKFCKKTYKKHITLLTYLLPCSAARVPVTSSRRWGTVGHLVWPLTECSW